MVLFVEGIVMSFILLIYCVVSHTKAWIIPGTEDLQPYIPKNVLVRKWIGTVVGYPLIAAAIAGVMTLL